MLALIKADSQANRFASSNNNENNRFNVLLAEATRSLISLIVTVDVATAAKHSHEHYYH